MNPDVVILLQTMLERANRGEITAIAVATCGPSLTTGYAYTLGDGTLAELVGLIAMLQHRVIYAGRAGPLD
jgi:hypothetical protein